MESNFSGASRLPKSHYSTYRQYKENEQKILRWVHETVADIRGTASESTNPPPTQHRPRAQRSRARNTRPARTHATIDPDFVSAKIPLRLFIQLVQEIADSEAVIPISYLNIFQLSIQLRKVIAAYYSPDADLSQSNRTHVFAIRAYIQAFDILKEAEGKRTKKDMNRHLREVSELSDDIMTLSEAINEASAMLDEDSINTSAPLGSTDNEWIRDNPMVAHPARSVDRQKRPTTFPLEEYELVMDDYVEPKVKKSSTTLADSLDALKCFLVDVYAMRRYCNDVWKSVAPAGKTSHIAASFVTNKAVQLVKEMEYALVADFPVLKDMEKCYEYLHEVIMTGVSSTGKKNEMGQAYNSLMDQIMFHTWWSLLTFGELLDKNPSPVLRDGHFGYFDPGADREQMTWREKMLEDRCIMCNHWPDIIVLNKLNIIPGGRKSPYKILGSQGLVQDFKEFCDSKSRNVSWALIFACQMQADSVHARRRYLEYDLSVMKNLGKLMDKEYRAFTNDGVLYSDLMEITARPFITLSITEVYNWIELDKVTEHKIVNGWDKLSKQATQKNALWLQNPWLTANIVAEASIDFFFAGVSVMGSGGFVQSTMQLWNMLRQLDYLPPRVSSAVATKNGHAPKDEVLLFDHLIDIFGDKVFSGPPPKSNFLISWEMMNGVRPEAFARGKRQLKKGTNPNRPHNDSGRGVEAPISDLYNMHQAKYFSNYKAGTASTSNKAVNKQKHPLVATLDLVNSELGQSATLPSQDTFEPLGPLININFFKVHRLCVDLFTELEPILRPDIERFIDGPLDHTQVSWSYLTGWIAMTETKAGNGGRPDRVMLTKAADVVQKFAGDKERAHAVKEVNLRTVTTLI
ncbi:hypothetical protein BDN70DRAFT_998916 [Pholiota conissans]|uniref:DUF6604 domain-containing protein n=1 Tax=Pholiota conissans TaxID=109636 RepID=A0A9P5YIH9_9AGAR|nr:hypothetical protein BDN70DRAFT_998916 [Pholiota conissans]